MKIGIIGAGNIGGALARRFRATGHEVFIANSRGPETLKSLADEIGAKAVTPKEAAHSGDVVVVTIPMNAIPSLPRDLFTGVPDSVVVIDANNYYPRNRDGKLPGIEESRTESEWVAQHLGRRVVKAFNNIYAQHLLERGKPAGTRGRIALPVSGDNANDKTIVIRLLDEIGFDGVDAGPISESWRQQPASPVYANDFDADGVRRALAEATPGRKPEWKATPQSPGTFDNPR
jgi:predicted dinucleotide-binding enzyme